MSVTPLSSASATPASGHAPAGRPRWAAGLLTAAAVLGGAALAGQPAWCAPALAVAGLLLAPWLLRHGPAPGSAAMPPSASAAPLQVAGQTPAGSLARQVVPVWRRNIDGARLHAEQSMSSLVEGFAVISSQLDQALQVGAHMPRLDSASIDELLQRHEPELQTLLASTRRVAALKDALERGIASLGEALAGMATLSKEVQTISRATHLLALNASVEAQRASQQLSQGSGASGFAVVAQEVRQLADQSRQAGAQLERQLRQLQDKVQDLRRNAASQDTDDDELALQADQAARAVMAGLLRGIDEVTRSQRSLRDAGQQVQNEVEQILVNLQSQDRMSQMLTSVTDDMDRLQGWLEGGEDEAAVSANRWLDRLEASYTMEDMRSTHHATAKVEQSAAVEFF